MNSVEKSELLPYKIGWPILYYSNIPLLLRGKMYEYSKSFLVKIIYVAIPFIVIGIMFMLTFQENVFYNGPNVFGFLNDYSNSIALVYIFIIGYFFSGYYPFFSQNIIKRLLKEKNNIIYENYLENNKRNWMKNIFVILSFFVIILAFSGQIFSFFAKNNVNAFWMNNISDGSYFYYLVILFFTWMFSLNLLLYALDTCFKISYILKENLFEYDVYATDNCMGLGKCSDILMINVILSISYILGILLICITDYVSFNTCGVENIFYSFPQICVLLIMLTAIIFSVMLIPLFECRNFIKKTRELELEEVEKLLERTFTTEDEKYYNFWMAKKEQLMDLDETLLNSFLSKIAVMFSIIIPIIGIILQIMQLFEE